VNFDQLGSGTNYSIRDVFKRLGINVEEVDLDQNQAFEKLKRGEIAATALIAGKPTPSMSRLTHADGLTFLKIPFTSALSNDFLPTKLTHEDYPEMIPEGQTVETIADSAAMISYNWPKDSERYRRVDTFINAFFPRIDEFQRPPYHVKWREINLAAKLEGWTRLESAQAWLDRNDVAGEHTRFEAYMRARHVPGIEAGPQAAAESDRLFEEFLKWKAGH
jgi:TRAP-type uncharacterized transport system substrate-binding protein